MMESLQEENCPSLLSRRIQNQFVFEDKSKGSTSVKPLVMSSLSYGNQVHVERGHQRRRAR